MSSWDEYKKTMISPLTAWSAAKDNDLPTLARLLDEGADLNARDHRGFSPLMLAAYAGHEEAFTLLLDRGADPNSTDLAGNSVLMGVAFKGHLDLATKLLAAGADASVKNHAGLDARGFADNFGRHDILALLDARPAGAPRGP